MTERAKRRLLMVAGGTRCFLTLVDLIFCAAKPGLASGARRRQLIASMLLILIITPAIAIAASTSEPISVPSTKQELYELRGRLSGLNSAEQARIMKSISEAAKEAYRPQRDDRQYLGERKRQSRGCEFR